MCRNGNVKYGIKETKVYITINIEMKNKTLSFWGNLFLAFTNRIIKKDNGIYRMPIILSILKAVPGK